jgi:hypothetical protein
MGDLVVADKCLLASKGRRCVSMRRHFRLKQKTGEGTELQLVELLVWYVVMQRPERWASGRYEKNGNDIGSRTCRASGSDTWSQLRHVLEDARLDHGDGREDVGWRRSRSVPYPYFTLVATGWAVVLAP